jgi:cytochrome c553
MRHEEGAPRTSNPWRGIGVAVCAILTVATAVFGFIILPVFGNGGGLGYWAAICQAFGVPYTYTQSSAYRRPPAVIASDVVWTPAKLAELATVPQADVTHGGLIALNCFACHGRDGTNRSGWIPNLAGMDIESLYKQLQDYRSQHRQWPVMNALAGVLSDVELRDVAAYFSDLPGGLARFDGELAPAAGRSYRSSDPAERLVYAGDPTRGIAPCAACHGLGSGKKRGAPTLVGQQPAYIERQLFAFQQGMRHNDQGEQMRVIAKQLKPEEIHGLAQFFVALDAGPSGKLAAETIASPSSATAAP